MSLFYEVLCAYPISPLVLPNPAMLTSEMPSQGCPQVYIRCQRHLAGLPANAYQLETGCLLASIKAPVASSSPSLRWGRWHGDLALK